MGSAYTLVADIGGTNARVGCARDGTVDRSTVSRLSCQEFVSAGALIRHYLAWAGRGRPATVCIAAAGPVRDGIARVTNLDWRIAADDVARAAETRQVMIINDLTAQGHALSLLGTQSLHHVLGPAMSRESETRLVVGIGTGFNAAPVFHDKLSGIATVPPVEVGHVDMPVWNEETLRLSRFLHKNHGVADVEEALSGRGLSQIYAFAAAARGDSDLAHHRTPLPDDIIAAWQRRTDDVARYTMELALALLGRVTANLALTFLPWGGIYLAGGVARALADFLHLPAFQDALYRPEGRLAVDLRHLPIHVIIDDFAALTGAAQCMQERIAQGGKP